MSKWWIVPLLTLIGLIGGFFAWMVIQRPIVEYSLADYPDMCTSDVGARLTCEIRNTGSGYSRVVLILNVENANISSYKAQFGNTWNSTRLAMAYDLPVHMDGYDTQQVTVTPVGNPQNFTISLSLENQASLWNFPNGWIGQWLEPHGYVTSLTYNKTQESTYELLH